MCSSDLWSKVNLGEQTESRPVATGQGFIFVSGNGTVVHASTNRTGSHLWRANLGMPVGRPPVVSNTNAYILSDDGRLVSLDIKTGQQTWSDHVGHVEQVIGIGKQHLYVQNDRGTLSRLRLSDGKVDGVAPVRLDVVIPNSTTDRLFVATKDGHLSCMREIGATEPTLLNGTKKKPEPSKTPAAPSTPKPNTTDDIFGSP